MITLNIYKALKTQFRGFHKSKGLKILNITSVDFLSFKMASGQFSQAADCPGLQAESPQCQKQSTANVTDID